DLAGRLLLGGDQPGVAAELLAALEATDGVDLQQDGHRDDPADPGDGLQRGEFGGGVLLGGDLDVAFESSDLGVEWAEQVQSRLDAAAGGGVGGGGGGGMGVALFFSLHVRWGGGERWGGGGGWGRGRRVRPVVGRVAVGCGAGRVARGVHSGRRRRVGSCRRAGGVRGSRRRGRRSWSWTREPP